MEDASYNDAAVSALHHETTASSALGPALSEVYEAARGVIVRVRARGITLAARHGDDPSEAQVRIYHGTAVDAPLRIEAESDLRVS